MMSGTKHDVFVAAMFVIFCGSLPRQSLNFSDDNRSLPLEPASVGKVRTVAANIRT